MIKNIPSSTLVEYKLQNDYEYIPLQDVIEQDLWIYPYIQKINNMNERIQFVVQDKKSILELQLISTISTNQFGKELDTLQLWKEEANNLFKQSDWSSAMKKYLQCLELALLLVSTTNELICSLYLNLAACYLKLNKFELCIEACNRVLSNDHHNTKALYRRGMAYQLQQQKELSSQDFSKAIAWIKQTQTNLDMIPTLEQAMKKNANF